MDAITELNTKIEWIEDTSRELQEMLVELSKQMQNRQAIREATLAKLRRNKAQQAKAFDALCERMGIKGEPIGAEKVQEMLAQYLTEENELSRAVIKARGE